MNLKSSLKRYPPVFLTFFLGLLLFSCGKQTLFDDYAKIPDNQWDRTKPVKFDFNIQDTLQPADLYINIRNTTDYRYSNIYLFLHTRFPDGKTAKDTIECILANPDGSWIGKGYSGIKENKIKLREAMKFRQAGRYHLEIEQAMRVEVLEGISNIGIRIQKHDPK